LKKLGVLVVGSLYVSLGRKGGLAYHIARATGENGRSERVSQKLLTASDGCRRYGRIGRRRLTSELDLELGRERIRYLTTQRERPSLARHSDHKMRRGKPVRSSLLDETVSFVLEPQRIDLYFEELEVTGHDTAHD
jgi:hypothetical protein